MNDSYNFIYNKLFYCTAFSQGIITCTSAGKLAFPMNRIESVSPQFHAIIIIIS